MTFWHQLDLVYVHEGFSTCNLPLLYFLPCNLAITAKFYVTFLSCAFFGPTRVLTWTFSNHVKQKVDCSFSVLCLQYLSWNAGVSRKLFNHGYKKLIGSIFGLFRKSERTYWYLRRLHFNFDPHVIFFSCRVLMMCPLDIKCKSPSKRSQVYQQSV